MGEGYCRGRRRWREGGGADSVVGRAAAFWEIRAENAVLRFAKEMV